MFITVLLTIVTKEIEKILKNMEKEEYCKTFLQGNAR